MLDGKHIALPTERKHLSTRYKQVERALRKNDNLSKRLF